MRQLARNFDVQDIGKLSLVESKSTAVRLMSYTMAPLCHQWIMDLVPTAVADLFSFAARVRHLCDVTGIDVTIYNDCNYIFFKEDKEIIYEYEKNFRDSLNRILHSKKFDLIVFHHDEFYHDKNFMDQSLIGFNSKTDLKEMKAISIFGLTKVYLERVVPVLEDRLGAGS
jgi:hypothetical protein